MDEWNPRMSDSFQIVIFLEHSHLGLHGETYCLGLQFRRESEKFNVIFGSVKFCNLNAYVSEMIRIFLILYRFVFTTHN